MKRIQKYTLSGITVLPLPMGSKILSCGNQQERITMWVEVEEGIAEVPRTFTTIGTGKTLPIGCQCIFIGTVMLQGGQSVVHVYELVPVMPAEAFRQGPGLDG